MNKKQRRTVIVLPADTHCGSTVGLTTKNPWQLIDGGYYVPNKIQHTIWEQWEECWRTVKKVRKNARLIVAHLGDAVEGVHHSALQLISQRIDEQQRIHMACMQTGMEIAKFDAEEDLLYYVTGTTFHTSPGSASEEIIARAMNAKAQTKGREENNFEDGRFTWDNLKLDVNGVFIDLAHHGPRPGGRSWLRGNNLRLALKSIYFGYLEGSQKPPRYWVRSHQHTWEQETYCGQTYRIDGFLTPCFKGMDEYSYKIGASIVNIGMLMIVIEENGDSSWQCERINIIPDPPQEV